MDGALCLGLYLSHTHPRRWGTCTKRRGARTAHVLPSLSQPHPRGYTVELISLRNGSPPANLNACRGCLPREVVYHACTKQSSTCHVAALFLNKVIALNGTYTEYKMIFMEKKVVRSLYTMEPACLVCRSSEYLTQGCGGLSLSHRWSLIRPHPVRRGKGSAVASLSLTVGH